MKKLNVVLVDDDQDEIYFMKDGFESTGLYNILKTLTNGEELITFINTLPVGELPDAIISDLNMPRKTGYDILMELSADKNFNKIPIIIISTSSTPSNIQRCKELGAFVYLVKPHSFTEYDDFSKNIYDMLEGKMG